MDHPVNTDVDLVVAAPKPESELLRRLFDAGYGRDEVHGAARAVRVASWMAFTTLLVSGKPVAKGRRPACAWRFWHAQLLRQRGVTYEASLGDGGRLICPPWSAIGAVAAATGTHEPADQAFVARFVRADDIVLDVGANIGFYAVPVALLGATVACFEPAPATLDVLRTNIERNGVSERVAIFDCALSDFDGTASFTVDRDAENHIVVGDGDDAAVVPMTVRTLDSFAVEHAELFDRGPVTLMKVDAEGFDEQVLAGSAAFLDTHRPVVMVETRRGGHGTRDFLEDRGYVACFYDYERHRLFRLPSVYDGDQFHMNMIAVPAERVGEVCHRVAEIAPPTFTARVRRV
jgi:FkbM family methyltransferase